MRQHVEELNGANANARGKLMVEDIDLYCGTQFSTHLDDISNACVHGNSLLQPENASVSVQTPSPWAASGLGSERWCNDTSCSHAAQRRTWLVSNRSLCVKAMIYILESQCDIALV